MSTPLTLSVTLPDETIAALAAALAARLTIPPPAALAADDRIAVSIDEAARLLSVSTRTVEELVGTGELPSGKVGARRLLRLDDLRRFAAHVVTVEAERHRVETERSQLRSLIVARQRRTG